MERIQSLPKKGGTFTFQFDSGDIKALSTAIVEELRGLSAKHCQCVEKDNAVNSTLPFLTFQSKPIQDTKNAGEDPTHSRSDPTILSRLELGPILCEDKEALCFLEEKGVITPVQNCPNCNHQLAPMSRNLGSKSRFVLHCCRRQCTGYSCSMLAGTILANCKLNKAKFVDFVYHWLLGTKHKTIEKALGMSSSLTADWANGNCLHLPQHQNQDCDPGRWV